MAAVAAAPIEIVVTDVRSDKGRIRLDLCDRTRFLKECAISGSAPAHAGSVTILLPAVPPGRYAIQAAHDENENGKLDRNMFGIPKEGVGFSQDVRICMGPPRFADAAFDHGAARQAMRVSIRYHLC